MRYFGLNAYCPAKLAIFIQIQKQQIQKQFGQLLERPDGISGMDVFIRNKRNSYVTVPLVKACTYPRLRICLQKKLSVSCARDGGVKRVPCVRSEWTCAHGSRVCCGASSVMVGMFFSYPVLFILSNGVLGVQR